MADWNGRLRRQRNETHLQVDNVDVTLSCPPHLQQIMKHNSDLEFEGKEKEDKKSSQSPQRHIEISVSHMGGIRQSTLCMGYLRQKQGSF